MKRKEKINPLLKDSYLAVIKNSDGSKMFRNFYVEINGRKKDILKNGEVSCAFFVSSVLVIFGLLKKIHLTISGALKDMRKSGWKEIGFHNSKINPELKKPKIGSVILWEGKKSDKEIHKHIGFYIGKGRATSNAFYFYKKRSPFIHHFSYNGKRKIEAIFWHKKLEK